MTTTMFSGLEYPHVHCATFTKKEVVMLKLKAFQMNNKYHVLCVVEQTNRERHKYVASNGWTIECHTGPCITISDQKLYIRGDYYNKQHDEICIIVESKYIHEIRIAVSEYNNHYNPVKELPEGIFYIQ